jgi:hypothetical protein
MTPIREYVSADRRCAERTSDAEPEERRQRSRHREVRPDVEAEQNRPAVQRRIGREENGGRQVVHADRCERRSRSGLPAPERVEERVGSRPPTAEATEPGCKREQQAKHAQIDRGEHARAGCSRRDDRGYADEQHRDRR